MTDPGAFVNTLYQAALAIGGLIGFGSLVYGAILYSIAGGNTSRAHEARAQITQAFLGLLLLFGAYLVLETINPNIVNSLQLPPLLDLEIPPAPPAMPAGECQGGSCAPIASPGVSCTPSSGNPFRGCDAAPRLVDRLRGCVENARERGLPISSLTITEAMPPDPTVHHLDPRHYNGCAVDLKIDFSKGGCKAVGINQAILQNCGLKVGNEYANCLKPGQQLPASTRGDHLHVVGC